MASEFQEQILHTAQCLIHMVAFNGTARTFYTVLTLCQYKRRLIVSFAHSSGNNSRQGFVTVRQVYDQNIVLEKLSIDLLKSLLHTGLGHVLALLVQIFEFCRQRFCPGIILSAQQPLQCQLCGL